MKKIIYALWLPVPFIFSLIGAIIMGIGYAYGVFNDLMGEYIDEHFKK